MSTWELQFNAKTNRHGTRTNAKSDTQQRMGERMKEWMSEALQSTILLTLHLNNDEGWLLAHKHAHSQHHSALQGFIIHALAGVSAATVSPASQSDSWTTDWLLQEDPSVSHHQSASDGAASRLTD
eukprot:GHVU01028870.1.p1 GENE.GHVU01028870.1~~GHVU01028870.1.p1  ORF type:complete len:126 (-),score=13.96 GHVU01028870.1:302-679(-)